MSGHSKWATIKHKKSAVDKAKGKLYAKILRQVEVAARQGGADVDANPTLRTYYEKARAASIPNDTINRAIKRGTGELEGVTYEEVTYEGYAPGGVAVFVETLTDNRNRTSAEVRSAFTRNGGSVAEPGAVAWQFERKGVVMVARSVDEDELLMVALDSGADDIVDEGDTWRVTTPPAELHRVESALADAGIAVESADLTMIPTSTVPLEDAESARRVLRVVDVLDEHDDVQNVYANFDIPDSILQAMTAEV
jgi:YebC/PmpR family DNA-binding regulatory protein